MIRSPPSDEQARVGGCVGDTKAVLSETRDLLIERGEKLSEIGEKVETMKDGSQQFLDTASPPAALALIRLLVL